MPEVIRSVGELNDLLDEQLDFIRLSCTSYDAGFRGEIKRLATAVRVLVHDTASSISLLKLLDKKGIDFYDSADPYDDENLLSHSSLVQFFSGDGRTEPRPHLDDGLPPRLTKFDPWWNGVVFVDKNKNEFSRRDIVLYLANKEGGAHVDPKIDAVYEALRKKNSLGWVVVRPDGTTIEGEDQVPATMRQIAHEVLKTFDPNYTCSHPESESCVIFRGLSIRAGTEPPDDLVPNLRKDRPRVHGTKIGRNDLCFCGSGKKFKRCCI